MIVSVYGLVFYINCGYSCVNIFKCILILEIEIRFVFCFFENILDFLKKLFENIFFNYYYCVFLIYK